MNGKPSDQGRDWTSGPAKWTAVVVLSGTGFLGLAYSILTDVPPRVVGSAEPIQIKAASPDSRESPAAPEPAQAPQSKFAQTINVNAATAAELDLLPGIGPSRAAAIIESREQEGPFRSLKDLERVSGIGPKTSANLGPYVRFE